MKGMILAAGVGARMGELTKNSPKPLLKLRGQYLIRYAIAAFKKAGIRDIIINVSYKADAIKKALGDGHDDGVQLSYSEEETRLETGGGIVKALPFFQQENFIVLSADVVTDFPLTRLPTNLTKLAHLVLVENPKFHPHGDFGLNKDNVIVCDDDKRYTFANIAVYQPAFFTTQQELKFQTPHCFPLSQLLFPAARQHLMTGEIYRGVWHNIGTPDDWRRAEADPNLPQL